MYRSRVNELRKQLQDAKPGVLNDAAYARYELMIRMIHEVLNKLKSTESSVMNIIRQSSDTHDTPQLVHGNNATSNEDEMFAEMKNCYNLFIRLQQAFNTYLKEQEISKAASPSTRMAEKPTNEPHLDTKPTLFVNPGGLEVKAE